MNFLAQAPVFVLSPILGLIGVMIGAVLTARREHQRWLRSERQRTYAAYLSSSQQWFFLAAGEVRWALTARDREALGSVRPQFLNATLMLLQRREEVRLLGPRDVAECLAEADLLMQRAMEHARRFAGSGVAEPAQWESLLEDFREVQDAFRERGSSVLALRAGAGRAKRVGRSGG